MTIPIEILALLSPRGFEERFHYHCKNERTYIKAYEEAEREYEDHFGKRRYSSYDSFRVVMNRKIKKRN
tara:strand:- start:91 stop:297 length:207 start_codon:yes stop_codon:yes gene_type:complete